MRRRRHHRRRRTRAGARRDRGEPGLTRGAGLLVPGLAAEFRGYPRTGLPALPSLSLWIHRARAMPFPAAWSEQAVAALCGQDAAQATPVAAMSYQADFGEPPPAGCLRADPVHLRADTRGLVLFDTDAFTLDKPAAQALVNTLDSHLKADAWRLVNAHPHRWYLLGERQPQVQTQPLPTVRGTSVPATSMAGAEAGDWTTRVNECQMLLNRHPLNLDRAAAGQTPVNSVWVWGEGAWDPQHAPRYSHIASDSPFTDALARRCGLSHLPVPENADALLAQSDNNDAVLAVLDTGRAAAAYEDVEAWQSALAPLETHWFAPLLKALKRRRLDWLDLYPLNGMRYRLTWWQTRSFWRGRGDYRSARGFSCAAASRV